MFHHQLKAAFNSSLENVSSRISSFVYKSGRDFSRTRKISPALLMSYLVSHGSSNTCCETLDFFRMVPDIPSASALNQQKVKLKPEAMCYSLLYLNPNPPFFSKLNKVWDILI